ncbi:hypothetical protein QYE76_045826 [Lolium multiflorum]|uniref:RNase H type-1 domain-containing protein n=1 Tax=Lolium multiflorum TaxID=4521 RepID=A0AAD8X0I0_LOLMU|nr:hypothetical protein QYE76_045826 [Lolium multiflorum]
MLTDCTPAAMHDKGKTAICLSDQTNHSGSCSSSTNRAEDLHPIPVTMPCEDSALIYVDAAHKPLTGDSAVGVVVRDQYGAIIAAVCKTIDPCQDAEEAEARAILAGLQLGTDIGLQQPLLLSDCAPAVSASRNQGPNLSKLWSVYMQISSTALQLPGCVVQYTRRKFNSGAHNLAQRAIRSRTCNLWLAPVPAVISDLVGDNSVNREGE